MLVRTIRNVILLTTNLIIILAVLEVYLRFFDPQSLRLSRPDEVLGWNHVPNTSGYWRKSCFSTKLEFNLEGMRDIQHATVKPPGIYRIAVIGDSFVTAQEVDLDKAFFRQLQQILNSLGHNVEVLGFGVRGFGNDQEYRLLENYALKYDPDLVILTFVPNDVRNNRLELEGNPAKPYFVLSPDGTLVQQPFTPMPDHSDSWKSILYKNLHSIRFVYFKVGQIPTIRNALVKFGVYANVVQTSSGPDDLMNNTVYLTPPWPPEWEKSWHITRELISEMEKMSTLSGAEFVLFSVTRAIQVDDRLMMELAKKHPNLSLSHDNLAKRLATFAEFEEIAYVSSLSAMRDLQASGKPAHLKCDGHWSPDAHKRAAELLADYLITGEYL